MSIPDSHSYRTRKPIGQARVANRDAKWAFLLVAAAIASGACRRSASPSPSPPPTTLAYSMGAQQFQFLPESIAAIDANFTGNQFERKSTPGDASSSSYFRLDGTIRADGQDFPLDVLRFKPFCVIRSGREYFAAARSVYYGDHYCWLRLTAESASPVTFKSLSDWKYSIEFDQPDVTFAMRVEMLHESAHAGEWAVFAESLRGLREHDPRWIFKHSSPWNSVGGFFGETMGALYHYERVQAQVDSAGLIPNELELLFKQARPDDPAIVELANGLRLAAPHRCRQLYDMYACTVPSDMKLRTEWLQLVERSFGLQ